jgi:hypothetical protein
MTEQQPSIGRIVHYRLSEQDVADIFVAHGASTGSFDVGDVLPAIVLRVNDPTVWGVDLSVQLGSATMLRRAEAGPDGATGSLNGRWFWPPRV